MISLLIVVVRSAPDIGMLDGFVGGFVFLWQYLAVQTVLED